MSGTFDLLTVVVFPTITGTLSASIALICLLRLKTVTHKKEIGFIVLICLSVMLWAFSDLWYTVSWRIGKVVAMSLVLTTLLYAYHIMFLDSQKFRKYTLYFSSVCLFALAWFPGITLSRYSLIFSFVVYPQVLDISFKLFSHFFRHRVKFYLVAGIMSIFMIGFGMLETFYSVFALYRFHGPLLGATAYVVAGWFLIVERGYFNTKTWTDYMVAITEKEMLLEEQNRNLVKSYTNAIIVLTQTIEAKDPYTRGHCLRVRNYSKATGQALGMSQTALQFLEYGAVLHDIGKVLIPGKILNKNGKLDSSEFALVKKHPQAGADILQNVDDFKSVIPMIRHHHESFDGNGYPEGLSGEAIPLEARILAVADTYDALTSTRPYRRALDTVTALDILKKISGSQLDPLIVKTFIMHKIYATSHAESELLFKSFQKQG